MDNYDKRRRPHYLRRNIRTATPTQLVFVDTETTPINQLGSSSAHAHHFRLGYAIGCRLDGGKITRRWELPFTHVSTFWDKLSSILSERRTTWLFAHSLGFDWTILGGWEEIELGHYSFADNEWSEDQGMPPLEKPPTGWKGILVAEDPPNIWTLRREGKTLTCVDTRNYWPESLAALGESVGLRKLGWDKISGLLQEPNHINPGPPLEKLPPWDECDEVWMDYCQRDTEIIEKAITDLLIWWKEQDLGTFRYTAAGLAWNAFRHRFLGDRQVLIHGHPAIDLERAAYYGGECRCFYCGPIIDEDALGQALYDTPDQWTGQPPRGPINVLDVTSLYPSVMRNNLFPVRLSDFHKDMNTSEVLKLPKGWGAISECLILSDTDMYPVRVTEEGEAVVSASVDPNTGLRIYKNGTTRYAQGSFWTVLCQPEIMRAHKAGHLLRVGRTAIYELQDIFTSFVDYFWESRLAAKRRGREVQAGFYKLLMNSLSGKFAQRLGTWQDDYDEPIFVPWGNWIHGTNAEGIPQAWRSVAGHAQRYTQNLEGGDSFPAISAFITAFGRELMHKFRQCAGPLNVYYQDTDSLHVSAVGLDHLTKAGHVETGQIGKLRLVESFPSGHYFGLKHYRHGNNIVCGAVRRSGNWVSDTEYVQSEFQRLPHILASRPTGAIVEREVTKHVDLCHPDGEPTADGWVRPLTL